MDILLIQKSGASPPSTRAQLTVAIWCTVGSEGQEPRPGAKARENTATVSGSPHPVPTPIPIPAPVPTPSTPSYQLNHLSYQPSRASPSPPANEQTIETNERGYPPSTLPSSASLPSLPRTRGCCRQLPNQILLDPPLYCQVRVPFTLHWPAQATGKYLVRDRKLDGLPAAAAKVIGLLVAKPASTSTTTAARSTRARPPYPPPVRTRRSLPTRSFLSQNFFPHALSATPSAPLSTSENATFSHGVTLVTATVSAHCIRSRLVREKRQAIAAEATTLLTIHFGDDLKPASLIGGSSPLRILRSHRLRKATDAEI
ncbi:hypothetical protein JHW43_004688 [Diplocarpon mali]|nr:hypothetical protein JHW43_004688 [Diplocarpon mali]